MKANYNTSKRDQKAEKDYRDLPEWQRKRFDAWMEDQVNDAIRHRRATVQKRWIQMQCIALRNTFGFGETRCMALLAQWKQIYRRVERMSGDKELQQFLDEETGKIFKDGFPKDWMDGMEEQTK